jgi:hypothetical protein
MKHFDNLALVSVAIIGVVVFSALVGAGVTPSIFSAWLLRPPDNLVTLIGASFVLAGLALTARQWRSDVANKKEEARSRRHQEYADRLERFRTRQTNAAIMMLLNYDRDVQLHPDEEAERVSWDDCAKALIPATFRAYLYDPKSTAIRDCFNDLIENISRLVFLEKEGLVLTRDVDHLCRTLLVRIANDPQFADTSFARNLRLYIQWRDAGRVLDLFRRYKCDIEPKKAADIAALKKEIAAGVYGDCKPSNWGSL